MLLTLLVAYSLRLMAAQVEGNTAAVATFTQHTDAFVTLGKASASREHKLIFAVQQRNTDKLPGMLLAVSDPASPSYGKHLTRSEVATLTADPAATAAVVAFLTGTAGVRVIKASLHGEYVTAIAPLAVWGQMLATAFVRVGEVGTGGGRSAVRCLQYTLPPPLRSIVATIFNTVQVRPCLEASCSFP